MGSMTTLMAKQAKLTARIEKKRAEVEQDQKDLSVINQDIIAQIMVEQNMSMTDVIQKLEGEQHGIQ
ncbi:MULTISPECIES: hypothetical protein [Leuconostoc]|uniref:Uncharacterized protein n=1 Tax=Leuconostoc inhae TaxID=178001 RepID=A0AAN2QUR7_9LACO|nr:MULTISPECIES: hypothetical protein [Leuconostoc]MBZ5947831.1 hypothetical protein [Leuconostoc gasicomitatum]MBZ5955681.1 hypothetical protein [Leuconostoc gasicomitatum]MBZ5960701.1 hypothetical protein [Leuconostoc gasicomitatum]MBZ5979919.1 hypothetical protein [Leuconostoc gasicomitatum]MBZ5983295.1 hypothetical protein [Leuconostoc gasicomitatum]